MIGNWISPIPQAAEQRAAMANTVPVLTTDRLILRAPQIEDWKTLRPIWRSDRARFIDGPYTEEDAYLDFAQATAAWILRGLGYWTVTRRSDSQTLGFIGIGQEIWDPELEFGWLLLAEAEGHGYAFEAACAVRDYAFDVVGLQTLISIIHRDNHRSIALARRLGAQYDPNALPDGAEVDHVYRHTCPTKVRHKSDANPTGQGDPK